MVSVLVLGDLPRQREGHAHQLLEAGRAQPLREHHRDTHVDEMVLIKVRLHRPGEAVLEPGGSRVAHRRIEEVDAEALTELRLGDHPLHRHPFLVRHRHDGRRGAEVLPAEHESEHQRRDHEVRRHSDLLGQHHRVPTGRSVVVAKEEDARHQEEREQQAHVGEVRRQEVALRRPIHELHQPPRDPDVDRDDVRDAPAHEILYDGHGKPP